MAEEEEEEENRNSPVRELSLWEWKRRECQRRKEDLTNSSHWTKRKSEPMLKLGRHCLHKYSGLHL